MLLHDKATDDEKKNIRVVIIKQNKKKGKKRSF